MSLKELFLRAVKSGCIVSIFYHIGMILGGRTVLLKQAITFTGMFIALYFVWLVMVSYGKDGRNRRR